MEVPTLQRHIAALAALEETEAPVLSCYLNLEKGAPACQIELAQRIESLKESLHPATRLQVDAAFGTIETYLREREGRGNFGLALFSRAGKQPFFLPLEFRVPLPTSITASSGPNIYHLAEVKDNYDRYVVLFATGESARILAIDLGSITQEVWKARPELRPASGSERAANYQNQRCERIRQFIRDEIRIAERLMAAGKYGHLILAGPARTIAALRHALPQHLLAKLVDVVSAGAGDRLADVVAATLPPFLEHEENESLAVVDRLLKQLHRHRRAVAGTRDSMAALRDDQAGVLVVAKDYQPGEGWRCRACGHSHLEARRPRRCATCQSDRLRQFDIKEEAVRLAARRACGIEIVNHSNPLMQLGGIGCLLRYATAAGYRDRAA